MRAQAEARVEIAPDVDGVKGGLKRGARGHRRDERLDIRTHTRVIETRTGRRRLVGGRSRNRAAVAMLFEQPCWRRRRLQP